MTERKRLYKKGVWVIASEYGNKSGKWRVGKTVKFSKHVVTVEFNDKLGTYQWKFSLKSGVRTANVGDSRGWKINLDDLNEWIPPAQIAMPQNRVSKVHEEVVPKDASNEDIVYSVFRDMKTGQLYFKGYRRNRKTGRERPVVVPSNKMLEVLGEFYLEWE